MLADYLTKTKNCCRLNETLDTAFFDMNPTVESLANRQWRASKKDQKTPQDPNNWYVYRALYWTLGLQDCGTVSPRSTSFLWSCWVCWKREVLPSADWWVRLLSLMTGSEFLEPWHFFCSRQSWPVFVFFFFLMILRKWRREIRVWHFHLCTRVICYCTNTAHAHTSAVPLSLKQNCVFALSQHWVAPISTLRHSTHNYQKIGKSICWRPIILKFQFHLFPGITVGGQEIPNGIGMTMTGKNTSGDRRKCDVSDQIFLQFRAQTVATAMCATRGVHNTTCCTHIFLVV